MTSRRQSLGLALVPALVLLSGNTAAAGEVIECVLAKVNTEIITLSEFDRQKRVVLEDIYRQRLSDAETKQALAEARDRLLTSMIDERLLLQKAKELGLAVSKGDVDRIVRSIMDENKIEDEQDLEQRLSTEGMTVAILRGNIERRSLIEKVKQFEIASRVVVTDEEAKRFYDANREEFRQPERLRLREIVLLTQDREPAKVKAQIEEISALVRNGADFAELATLFSQAPTAEHGGDLGLLDTKDLTPEIASVATELEPGEVSIPIETRFGYHILKLMERKPVTYLTYEDAKERITAKVQQDRYGERVGAYLVDLKRTSFVEVVPACQERALSGVEALGDAGAEAPSLEAPALAPPLLTAPPPAAEPPATKEPADAETAPSPSPE